MPSTSERCIWQRSLTAAVLLSLGIFLIGCNGAGSAASTSSSQSANDPPPSLAISSSSPLPQGQVSVQYQFQFTVTGGTSPYTWQVASGSLAPGLSIESGSGSVSGTPQKSGSYSFTVDVQDSAGHTAQAQFSQAIAPPALAVSTSSLAQGTIGSSYSASLAATGGTTPYGWQITAGQLPPGLGLTSAGQISGTPTAAGAYNFTAQVSDSSSPVQTASAKLSITIAALALTIGTAALPTGTLNSAYNAALSATGGTTPYTWSVASGSLPAGLSLSSSGQISGMPTAIGTSTFTVQASDSSSPSQTVKANESIRVDAVTLDAYGGRTDITCSTGATGYWTVETINGRDWFCDPLGNAFDMHAVEYVNWAICHKDAGGQGCSTSRFGSAENWAQATAQRLLSWGFNTYGVGEYTALDPWNTNYGGVRDKYGNVTIPYKVPVVGQVSASPYAESSFSTETFSEDPRGGNLDQPVKEVEAAVGPEFTGYVPAGGFPADIYDSRYYSWTKYNLAGATQAGYLPLPGSPYQHYLIGMFSDDGDYTFGLIQSLDPAYPTTGGTTGEVFGWVVAISSPIQYALKSPAVGPTGVLYHIPTVYTKKAWESYLTSKYGTVSALNAAWGSNYTTFGSSGTQITKEAVGTGDGTTTTFAHTLANLTPSEYSLAVYTKPSGGTTWTLLGGDTGGSGTGTIWGPSVSGTITYSTGAVSITFATAPASGTTIAVDYVQNGYCLGTGLLDECDQSSHRSWMGTDTTGTKLTGVSANLVADVETFSEQAAAYYLSNYRSAIRSVYPHMLFFGPDPTFTWGGIAEPWVLKALAGNVDAVEVTDNYPQGGSLPQTYLNEIYKYAGDLPLFMSYYTAANADSELKGYTKNTSNFTTQAARGQYYLSTVGTNYNAAYSDGVHPYVGTNWWRYYDDWTEMQNWGIVTARDNSYDGHEATGSAVACSSPLSLYSCGADLQNVTFGDLIQYLRQANGYWLSH